MREVVHAEGHPNVSARHPSTLEVTCDPSLTPAGDCIIGVGADRGPAAFDPAFMDACRTTSAVIEATLSVEDRHVTIRGHGHPDLTFASDRSAVIRTSSYVDDRTVMVGADAAAADLERSIVDRLQSTAPLRLRLSVDP